MKIAKIYLSNSKLTVISSTVFVIWIILSLAALVWAYISHPPVIHLLWPLIIGFLVFKKAENWKRKRILGPLDPRDIAGLMVFFLPLALIELVLLLFNIFELSFWRGILPGLFVYILWCLFGDFRFKASCYLCFKGHPFEGEKKCPSCEQVFKGGGWAGFRAHWNEHHASELPFDELWDSLCDRHKKKSLSYINPSIESYIPLYERVPVTKEFKHQKLCDLNLPNPIVINLAKNGVTHIYQLVELTEEQCLSLRGIAEKTIDTIKQKLSLHDLSLGMKKEKIISLEGIDLANNEINFLGLSNRLLKLLALHKIDTIQGLLALGEAKIYYLPRLSKASFSEITKVLVEKKIWSKIEIEITSHSYRGQ